MSADDADNTEAVTATVGVDAGGLSQEGWAPVEGVGEPDDEFTLGEIELLAEVSHPVRSRIMRALRTPRTVAEVAALLDAPVTRLYHHVNRLEQLGFIRVVATRKVAAVTERRYQVAARSMRMDPKLFESLDRRDLALALGSLFDLSKHNLQREIEHGDLGGHESIAEQSVLTQAQLVLPPERRAELARRLEQLVGEFIPEDDSDAPDGERIEVFIALFPTSP